MSPCRPLRRIGLTLALAAGLAALQGCTPLRSVGVYGYDRAKDGLDMVDLGVTITPPWKPPTLSIYGCLAGLFSAGYGSFDGYYTGVGGNGVRLFHRHYHYVVGLGLWSYEEFGWGDFDKHNRETLAWRYVGVIGWLFFPKNREFYGPAWMHCLHVGYVGIMANIRYFEIPDFFLGWFGLDVAGDDYATRLRAEARLSAREAAREEAEMAKTPDGKSPKDSKEDVKAKRPIETELPKPTPRKPGKAETGDVNSPKESPEPVAEPRQESLKPPVKDSPKKPVRQPSTGLERKIDVGPLDGQP